MSNSTDLNLEKSRDDSQPVKAPGSTGPVMLALSTFKYSDKAIEAAIKKAGRCKKLIIVYGRQVSLWLYFLETDIGFYPCWKEQCEKELLTEIHHQWAGKVEGIANRASRKFTGDNLYSSRAFQNAVHGSCEERKAFPDYCQKKT